MKMNIKGLVFVGFAAAVFASAANAANDKIVTSKTYVDTKYIGDDTTITLTENEAGQKVIALNSTLDTEEYTGTAPINVDDHTITVDAMTGASASAAGSAGVVPAPAAGDNTKVLSGAGTWIDQPTVNDAKLTISIDGTNTEFTANDDTAATVTINTMDGASASSAGTKGLVPAPSAGDQGKFLRGDGTWSDQATVNDAKLTISIDGTNTEFTANDDTDTTVTINTMDGASASSAGTKGLVPAPSAGDNTKVLSGAGTWIDQPTVNDAKLTISIDGTNTEFTANDDTAATVTINTMGGASASSAGTKGLVPAPAQNQQDYVLKGDGTWGEMLPIPLGTTCNATNPCALVNAGNGPEWQPIQQ